MRRRFDPAIDASEIALEIAARLREELDYVREAATSRSTAICSSGDDIPASPRSGRNSPPAGCSRMDWLTGRKLLDHKDASLAVRNRIATAMFTAWWFPFSRFGVIHGDPHLGNYTVFDARRRARRHQSARLWLHPHFPAELRRRRGRSLSRPAPTATARWSCTPTRPGASICSTRTDRRAQYLGAVHLRPAARRPGAHHRRRRQAVAIRPQAKLSGCTRR